MARVTIGVAVMLDRKSRRSCRIADSSVAVYSGSWPPPFGVAVVGLLVYLVAGGVVIVGGVMVMIVGGVMVMVLVRVVVGVVVDMVLVLVRVVVDDVVVLLLLLRMVGGDV